MWFSASSGHGRVWFGVDKRYSMEIVNQNWYKSQNSVGSSGSGQKFQHWQKFSLGNISTQRVLVESQWDSELEKKHE